jgi:dTDP-4-amino-4,6-dideoxygalactose transaminase
MTDSLALLGGDPVQTLQPATYPRFDEETLAHVTRFLSQGPVQGLSKQHDVVRAFEERFAAFHEVPHCLATGSGHGALHSALIGLEITAGDHVLTSPYSWGASVSCILHNGALPVFADVDPATGLLDPARLGDCLTPQTTAILVPHIFGQPADMTAIMAFAQAHGLRVIEDACQAHGATHAGRPVGGIGDAAGFSINGIKPIATGEGGYMLTRHADVYWKAVLSGQHAGREGMPGRATEDGFPDELRACSDSLVYTYRPNCVSAILALHKLDVLERENEVRRQHVRRFLDGIADVEFLRLPAEAVSDSRVYYMLSLDYDAELAGVARDTFLRALRAEGVKAVAYVERPLHRLPRLSPDWSGPRVMWTETLRRAGVDPTQTELPGCEAKVARSVDLPWNYAEPQPALIDQMAEAFRKVARGLDALRAYERARAGSSAASVAAPAHR